MQRGWSVYTTAGRNANFCVCNGSNSSEWFTVAAADATRENVWLYRVKLSEENDGKWLDVNKDERRPMRATGLFISRLFMKNGCVGVIHTRKCCAD